MATTALRSRSLPTDVLDGVLALLMGLGAAYGLVGVVVGLTSEAEMAGVAVIVGGFVLAVAAPGAVLILAGRVRRARTGKGRRLLLAGRVASVVALLATAWWFGFLG